MKISVASELMRVLKLMGFGSPQYAHARDALPVNGVMPIVADVNKLRLDGSLQGRFEDQQRPDKKSPGPTRAQSGAR